jgi:hypothetical protein
MPLIAQLISLSEPLPDGRVFEASTYVPPTHHPLTRAPYRLNTSPRGWTTRRCRCESVSL